MFFIEAKSTLELNSSLLCTHQVRKTVSKTAAVGAAWPAARQSPARQRRIQQKTSLFRGATLLCEFKHHHSVLILGTMSCSAQPRCAVPIAIEVLSISSCAGEETGSAKLLARRRRSRQKTNCGLSLKLSHRQLCFAYSPDLLIFTFLREWPCSAGSSCSALVVTR